MWFPLILFSVSVAFFSPSVQDLRAEERKVDVVVYEGIINPVAAELISRGLSQAREDQAEAVIIQLDTPGGLDQSMRIIVKEIIASEVPVVVYVSPSGARAASAGVFITLAAHVAAMAPGTNIGAAHPVALGGGEIDKEMKTKIENDAAAYAKSLAEKRGRNAKWAEEAVRKSVSASETEAKKLKIIDLVAENLDGLLAALDGREVVTEKGKRVIHTKEAHIKKIEKDLRLRILSALSDPNVAYILLIIGTYGLIFELSNPGAIFPGVVGAISLILAFYAFQTLPINYAGLLLIGLAIILFIAEVMVVSYGILTIGGIVSMGLGSLMLFSTPDLPSLRISLSVVLSSVGATALFFLLVIGAAWRAQKRQPVTGSESLIGSVGIARTAIAPRGRVLLRGEFWEAMSSESEPIKEGEEVEIKGIEGLTLRVIRRQRKEGS